MTSLALAAHGSVHETPPWISFLRACRDALGLSYASLVFRRSVTDRFVYREFADADRDVQEYKLRYRRELFRKDTIPYHAMGEGRVFRLAEVLGGAEPLESQFYRDCLRPMGLDDLVIARLIEPSGYEAWLTLGRQAAIADPAVAEVEALVPHVRLALQTFALTEKLGNEQSMFGRVAERVDLGTIAVRSDLKVVNVGHRAQEILQQTDLVGVTADGYLRLASAPLAERLARVVASFAETDGEWAFQLDTEPRIQVLVTPPSLQPRALGPAATAAHVYLHRLMESPAGRQKRRRRLVTLFGLTPLEAAIADELCAGKASPEIAANLGLTNNTVRTYFRTIFEKTGSHRQADVVKAVLESIAAIA